nr:hypothetical protein [uncultured Holophaga sp.]
MLLLMTLLAAGCRRREEKSAEAPAALPPGHEEMVSRRPSVIQVPEGIRGKWDGARFRVVEIASGKSHDFTASLGKESPVPGTSLVIRPEVLLPHFTMGDGVITSRDGDLANPAAKVSILEGGKPLFTGWLFSLYPEAHPFEHPVYQMRLLAFVPAKGAH